MPTWWIVRTILREHRLSRNDFRDPEKRVDVSEKHLSKIFREFPVFGPNRHDLATTHSVRAKSGVQMTTDLAEIWRDIPRARKLPFARNS